MLPTAPYIKISLFLLCGCMIFATINTADSQAQPSNEALKIYLKALNEQSLQSKTSLLQQALQLDPNFVDAHYALGKAYDQLGEFDSAKKHLMKAYTTRIGALSEEQKSTILYALASTYVHLGEPKAAEDALRGAQNLTGSDQLRREIALKLAGLLFQQNRFEEVLSELSHVVLNTASEIEKKQAQNLSAAAEKAVEANRIYRLAEEAVADGNSRKAQTLFKQIEKKLPGFRDVQQRIARLAANESTTQHGLLESDTPAKTANTVVLPVAKSEKSDPPVHRISTSKPISNRPITGKSGSNRKKTIATPSIVAIAPMVEPQNAGRLSSEKTHAEKRVQKRIPRTVGKEWLPELDVSDENLNAVQTASNQWRLALVALTLGLFVAAVMTLVFLVNTSVRAKLMARLGKRTAAINLYESVLSRQPDRLWLYPALAELYDQENRKDERAIRVYRMIQHLDIKGQTIEALRLSVSNKYLSDVETAPVKIEILQGNKNG